LPGVLRGEHINGWFTFVGERMLDYSIERLDKGKRDV
jgi:hypothetical protein